MSKISSILENTKFAPKVRKALQIAVFDISKDNEYQAEFMLGPNVVQCLEFTVDKAECNNLTYDEVESKAYAEAEKLWPASSFPNLELKQIRIHCTETDEFCDVFSESMKDEISEYKKSGKKDRYLVLPDAMYSITPEAKLWLSLKEQKIISEDVSFDYDEMHAVIESTKTASNGTHLN